MVVGIRDIIKLFGIAVIACCAVFVCTLFLNYNIDLKAIESEIATEAGRAMYAAMVSMGKVTAAVSGGCLAATSVVMLLFYVKNHIDSHGRELGILKALGYSEGSIAKHFWVFGLSVLLGCGSGFGLAFSYMPTFYKLNNEDRLFPEITVRFHPLLTFLLTAVPTVFFMFIAVAYACLKLKSPVLDLLREKRVYKVRVSRKDMKDLPFLPDLKKTILRGKKTLVFFIAFSAFCFSAMVQMSLSMKQLSSETFAFMIISIGLILAFMTLFLTLSSVVKANTKTIAMMRVFGYNHRACSRTVLGCYRPFSYLGFAVGTIYQYMLLKLMMTYVFADIENMPEYHFDFKALAVTFPVFVIVYELIMYAYASRIKKLSLKSVMLE